jgi:two-component system, LytTR family, response regulator
MKLRKAIIVDDETDARRIISKYTERYAPDVRIVAEANTVASALEKIREHEPDLVFLDINLSDGSGFDVLDNVYPIRFQVIFTTAFDQYAVKAFRYHAIDYLLKPIDPDAFREAVDKVATADPVSSSENIVSWMEEFGRQGRKLSLPTSEGLTFIDIDRIEYFEADGSYCIIHMEDRGRHVISKPLKYFSEKISGNRRFMRPHKSYIVNISCIEEYIKEDGGSLRMRSGARIPISRQKKDDILRDINEYFL